MVVWPSPEAREEVGEGEEDEEEKPSSRGRAAVGLTGLGGMGGASPAIKPIGKSVVHRICSGQVIFDLSSAVKELVENSLDAGASTVEVSLKAYGEEWFKVSDNGSGISPSNFQARTPHS